MAADIQAWADATEDYDFVKCERRDVGPVQECLDDVQGVALASRLHAHLNPVGAAVGVAGWAVFFHSHALSYEGVDGRKNRDLRALLAKLLQRLDGLLA